MKGERLTYRYTKTSSPCLALRINSQTTNTVLDSSIEFCCHVISPISGPTVIAE